MRDEGEEEEGAAVAATASEASRPDNALDAASIGAEPPSRLAPAGQVPPGHPLLAGGPSAASLGSRGTAARDPPNVSQPSPGARRRRMSRLRPHSGVGGGAIAPQEATSGGRRPGYGRWGELVGGGRRSGKPAYEPPLDPDFDGMAEVGYERKVRPPPPLYFCSERKEG